MVESRHSFLCFRNIVIKFRNSICSGAQFIIIFVSIIGINGCNIVSFGLICVHVLLYLLIVFVWGSFEVPRHGGRGRGESFFENLAVETERLCGVVGECVETRDDSTGAVVKP